MHLEQGDLIDRPKAILVRANDAEILQLLAFEIENGINDVLERLRSGNRSLFCDVADQKNRQRQTLCCRHQNSGGVAHLSDGAGRGVVRRCVHGLNRIDDDRHRLHLLRLGDDPLDRCFGEEANVLVHRAEAARAKCDLTRRLFARNVENGAAVGERLRSLQQQRRLTDARLAADKRHRAEHQPAAEDAVERGNARREPRRSVRVNVIDADRDATGCRAPRSGFFDRVRVPCVAFGAAAEPFRRLIAAFDAGVDRRRLFRHRNDCNSAGRALYAE